MHALASSEWKLWELTEENKLKDRYKLIIHDSVSYWGVQVKLLTGLAEKMVRLFATYIQDTIMLLTVLYSAIDK